jgi:hypothetical protein
VGAHHLLRLVFGTVAVAFEDDDFGVVGEAVEHRGDGDGISKDLRPGGEALVG